MVNFNFCPQCRRVTLGRYKNCSCEVFSIEVAAELLPAVQLLIERGFDIECATYSSYWDEKKETMCSELNLVFEKHYNSAIFAEPPTGWAHISIVNDLGKAVSCFRGYTEHRCFCDEEWQNILFMGAILEEYIRQFNADICKFYLSCRPGV